jgi:hypothetical protein
MNIVVEPPEDVGKKFYEKLAVVRGAEPVDDQTEYYRYAFHPHQVKNFIEKKFGYPITPLPMNPTPYEVGNDIMHNLCDKMAELEGEIREIHPEVAMVLRKNRLMYGPLVNELMDQSMCPCLSDSEKIRTGLQGLITRARGKYENHYRRKQNNHKLGNGEECH